MKINKPLKIGGQIVLITALLGSIAAQAESPDWVHDSQRRVIGGDIIHWGTGESETSEVSLFKARQMAIKEIIEECGGLASKYITPRQQHVEPSFKGYRAFAKVSIEWSACDYGKKPAAKKDANFENQKIVESQKLYDQLLQAQTKWFNGDKTKEIETNIKDLVKAEQDYVLRKMDSLEDRVNDLENKRPIVQQIQQVRMPATSSQKKVCEQEVDALLFQLNLYSPHGNIQHPSMRPLFNQFLQKRASCAYLK